MLNAVSALLLGWAAALAVIGWAAAAPVAYAAHTPVLVVDFPYGSGDGDLGETRGYLLDVGPTGMFAMSDPDNSRVKMFHPNGTHAFDVVPQPPYGGYSYARGEFSIGPTGEIFVEGCEGICVFHPNGTYAYSFNAFDFVESARHRSHGIAVGHDGLIVMLDLHRHYERADRIVYIHPNGTLSHYAPLSVDITHSYSGYFTIDPDGMIVVAGHGDIHKFHPNGTLAVTYGIDWIDYGNSHYLMIAAGPDGGFVVYSPVFERFYFVGPGGERLFSFDSWSDGHGYTRYAYGLDFDPSGRLLVFDGYRLTVFEIESLTAATPLGPERQLPAGLARPGDHAQAYGSPGRPPLTGGAFAFEFGSYGEGPGEFLAPRNIAVGPGGAIAVSDAENDRIQLFHPNGTFAFELGSRGSGPGELIGPYGITFGPNGLLVVADVGNHRVQVFRIQ